MSTLPEQLMTPLYIKKSGRPQKFFQTVLLIVIYKILIDEIEDAPIEKTKEYTAMIVSEFIYKYMQPATINHRSLKMKYKAKDVDNALHST